MRFISIIIVMLALAAGSAEAGVKSQGMRGVYGLGTFKCSTWIEAKDAGNDIMDWRVIAWVNGYLSGRSLSRVAKYRNVLGETTVDNFWTQIEKDCRRSPDLMFGGVVHFIVKEVEAGINSNR